MKEGKKELIRKKGDKIYADKLIVEIMNAKKQVLKALADK